MSAGGKEIPGTDGRWKEYESEGRVYYYDTMVKRTTWRDPRRPNPRAFVNAISRAWSTAPTADGGSESSRGSRGKVTPLPLHELKYAPGEGGGGGGGAPGEGTGGGEGSGAQGLGGGTLAEASPALQSLGSKQRGVAGLNRLKVLQSISNDIGQAPAQLGSWREQQTAALINRVAARHGLPPPPKDRANMIIVNGEFCESSYREMR